jgi:hypothetical protein
MKVGLSNFQKLPRGSLACLVVQAMEILLFGKYMLGSLDPLDNRLTRLQFQIHWPSVVLRPHDAAWNLVGLPEDMVASLSCEQRCICSRGCPRTPCWQLAVDSILPVGTLPSVSRSRLGMLESMSTACPCPPCHISPPNFTKQAWAWTPGEAHTGLATVVWSSSDNPAERRIFQSPQYWARAICSAIR